MTKSFVLALILFGSAMAPVHAESDVAPDGSVTIYTRSGGIIHRQITDQSMLDSLTKDATVIPEGGAIMMRGGKWYLVMEHKMSDGTMLLNSMAKQ